MKKFAVMLTVIAAVLALQPAAMANSGPTYQDGSLNGALTVDKACPITVEHEELLFEIPGTENDTWHLDAKVTASYEMKNPTDEAVTVTMAFPTIASAADETVSSVTVGGEAVEYDMYYGDEYGGGEGQESAVPPQLDLEDVLGNVSMQEPYDPGIGTLYTITPIVEDESVVKDGIYYVKAFFSIPDGSQVLLDGESSFGISDEGSTVDIGRNAYPTDDDNTLTIYAVGGCDIGNIDTAAYETVNGEDISNGIRFEITEQEMALYDYLESSLRNYYRDGEKLEISEQEYWCILEYCFDDVMQSYNNAVSVSDLWQWFKDIPRLCMAVYTVDFEPGETKNVTVESLLRGEMKRPSGYSQIGMTNTFTYLSNPAKNWASFGTIDMTVSLGAGISPISASQPALTDNGDGTYTASLDGLPEENISFVVGAEATEEDLNELKKEEFMKNKLGMLVFVAAIMVFIICLIVFTLKKLAADAKEVRERKRK